MFSGLKIPIKVVTFVYSKIAVFRKINYFRKKKTNRDDLHNVFTVQASGERRDKYSYRTGLSTEIEKMCALSSGKGLKMTKKT